MRQREDKDIRKISEEGTLIDQAVQEGVRRALRRHKLLGHSVPVQRNGHVIWIKPEDIPVDKEGPTT